MFLIYIDGLLYEIEKSQYLSVKFSENNMPGLLFADDFVGVAESKSALQSMITIVYNYSRRWSFKDNVKKCAVVVCSKLGDTSGKRFWGNEELPVLDSYCYLGMIFRNNGSWDKHIKSLLIHNRQKLIGLYCVLHNFASEFKNCTHIYMAMLRPSLEYDCEVWNTNKCQDKVLESIQLYAGKYILGCCVTTCDEPVHVDLGLETLKIRRYFHKLKWYRKIKHMNNQKLPSKLITNRWDRVKSRGHHRKSLLAQADSLMKYLDL